MRKAKEISLERVYNHCMRQVAGKMSVHNAVGWFVEADEHGLEDVRAAAFGFLARNLAKVKTQASETLEMLADQPRLTMQLMLEQARVLEQARARERGFVLMDNNSLSHLLRHKRKEIIYS